MKIAENNIVLIALSQYGLADWQTINVFIINDNIKLT